MKKIILVCVLSFIGSSAFAFKPEDVIKLKETGNCVGCDLSDLKFNQVTSLDFYGADLTDANLTNSELMRRDFRNANLTNALFNNADLTEANIRGAKLSNTDFEDAIMSHADLRDTDQKKADFDGVIYDDFSSDI